MILVRSSYLASICINAVFTNEIHQVFLFRYFNCMADTFSVCFNVTSSRQWWWQFLTFQFKVLQGAVLTLSFGSFKIPFQYPKMCCSRLKWINKSLFLSPSLLPLFVLYFQTLPLLYHLKIQTEALAGKGHDFLQNPILFFP